MPGLSQFIVRSYKPSEIKGLNDLIEKTEYLDLSPHMSVLSNICS